MLTTRPPRMSVRTVADDRFRKYRPEEAKAIRVPEVRESKAMRRMREAWGRYEHDDQVIDYGSALETIKKIRYSAEDVEKFSIELGAFQDEEGFVAKAGLFLSALINNGRDESYTIHLDYLAIKPKWLCWENTKNVTIYGDVGECCGSRMAGGKITIKGNADSHVGDGMERGVIEVEGNADCLAGYCMKGGKLVIKGNARFWLGRSMSGGEIIVEGDTEGEIGREMNGGLMLIKGSTEDRLGKEMTGGRIVVMKNAEDNVGENMKGGVIDVRGNTGERVGLHMEGGRIYLRGEYVSIGRSWKGITRVYHRGKPISTQTS